MTAKISKKEPFIRSMTNGGSAAINGEKRDILIRLWEMGCISEVFMLGSSSKEWNQVQSTLKDKMTYKWPRFNVRKGYKVELKSLLPSQWGENKETFDKKIKSFLSFDDRDYFYTPLINNGKLLYTCIYGMLEYINMIYDTAVIEDDSCKITMVHDSLKITVEFRYLAKFKQIYSYRPAIIPNDVDPELYEDYMDKRKLFALLRCFDISMEKKYTLPELCETLFNKFIVNIDISRLDSFNRTQYKSYPSYKLYLSNVIQKTKYNLFEEFIGIR
jgi:hypothetical protein